MIFSIQIDSDIKQDQRHKNIINQGNKQETNELILIWVFSCLRKIVVWAKEFHVSPNPSWQIILPAKCSVHFWNTCKIVFEVLLLPAKCFGKTCKVRYPNNKCSKKKMNDVLNFGISFFPQNFTFQFFWKWQISPSFKWTHQNWNIFCENNEPARYFSNIRKLALLFPITA